jgi:hypothetical protein
VSLASFPAAALKEMAASGWEFVRANHTREKFVQEFRAVVTRISVDQAATKTCMKVNPPQLNFANVRCPGE